MTVETLTTVFGWIAILNLGYLMLATAVLFFLQDWVVGIHTKWFDLEPEAVRAEHYRFLANYKIVTLVFAVAPYLALKLI
jgi:Family of unknown function (DUF6868)